MPIRPAPPAAITTNTAITAITAITARECRVERSEGSERSDGSERRDGGERGGRSEGRARRRCAMLIAPGFSLGKGNITDLRPVGGATTPSEDVSSSVVREEGEARVECAVAKSAGEREERPVGGAVLIAPGFSLG